MSSYTLPPDLVIPNANHSRPTVLLSSVPPNSRGHQKPLKADWLTVSHKKRPLQDISIENLEIVDAL